MDLKTIILLLAAGQGFMLSLVLISKFRKTHASNVFLGIIVFVISIEILNDFAMQLQYHSSPDSFPFWILGSYLLLPPSLWLFAKLNLVNGFKFHRRHLLLFIPALVEMFIETFVGRQVNLMEYPSWFLLAEVSPLLGMIGATIFYGKWLFQIRKKALETGLPAIQKHVNKHVVVFGIFFCLTFIWTFLVFTPLEVFVFVEILLVTSVFCMGYVAYTNPSFFDVPKAFRQAMDDKKEFSHYDDNSELSRLSEALHLRKLYARNKLSLNELARELKLPSRYVSYLINTYHQTSFQEFVNSLRVQEVINKLKDPKEQHKTLLSLAMEAGFNSKSAFNYVFKSQTGQTPSRYLATLKK